MKLRKTNYEFLLHFVVPSTLLISSLIRISGLSLIYAILLLLNPFISAMDDGHVSMGSKRYLRTCLASGFMCALMQFVFHVSLLSHPPYGHHFIDCDYYEKILRQIGFQRLDEATIAQAIRLLSPEITVLLVLIFVNRFRWKFEQVLENHRIIISTFTADINLPLDNPPKHFFQKYRASIEKITTCLTCGISGIIYPCLFAIPYFITFLITITIWAMNRDFAHHTWHRIRICILSVSLMHIVMLYLYQMENFFELLLPSTLEARMLGLLAYVGTSCSNVRVVVFYCENVVVKILTLISLVILYATNSVIVANFVDTSMVDDVCVYVQKPQRNETSDEIADIDNAPSSQHGFVNMISNENVATEKCVQNGGNDCGHPSKLQLLKRRLSTVPHSVSSFPLTDICIKVLNIVTKESYIIMLIVMMAWSVTYHSWFTFVLLMLSCIVWLLPNPRKFCYSITPYLVVYAEIIVIFQYVYSFQLTESELPSENPKILRQIGLEKPKVWPAVVPLFIKITYTLACWTSLRQHLKEKSLRRKEKEKTLPKPFSSVFASLESLSVESEFQENVTSSRTAKSKLLSQSVQCLKEMISKFWIVVCCIVLLFISVNSPVLGYRTLYMVFLLVLENFFLLSFKLWRRLLYYFWSVVIVYCMIVLTFVYTYQFPGFPEIWKNITGFSDDVLQSLGLETYSSGELLMKLLTPITFLLCAIIQLRFFHKPLIANTEKIEELMLEHSSIKQSVKKTITRATFMSSETIEIQIDDLQQETTPMVGTEEQVNTDKLRSHEPMRKHEKEITTVVGYVQNFTRFLINFLEKYHAAIVTSFWSLLTIHIHKIIGCVMMAICISEVSIVNVPYVCFIVVTFTNEYLVRCLSTAAAIWTSFVVAGKLLFQMKFVDESNIPLHCSIFPDINDTINDSIIYSWENNSVKNAAWIGLHKTEDVSRYLSGYLLLMGLFVLQELLYMRQILKCNENTKVQRSIYLRNILFPHITRKDADGGLPSCIMYFINYGFYKFGLEICYISTLATVGLRRDFVSMVFMIILMYLMTKKRDRLRVYWPAYAYFLTIMLPLQYIFCVGIPTGICISYPWSTLNKNALEWMCLPDFTVPPNPVKLWGDFFQFLFACCQWYVFEIEATDKDKEYLGGNNDEPDFANDNERTIPTYIADFISHQKSYLDLLKNVLFMYLYWVTLSIVFVCGVSRVTIFSLGYVIVCFYFLWKGNELFLKPLRIGLQQWNILIAYNVIVIFIKTSLQIIGCIYLDDLYKNYCWALQLFGIACLKTGTHPSGMLDPLVLEECNVPTDEAGILFDGICFCFLIIQRRIFTSSYFNHVIAEFRAQQVFASRGAELIRTIQAKEIHEQVIKEKELVNKLVNKMRKIKDAQKGPRDDKLKKLKPHKQVAQTTTTENMEELPVVSPPFKKSVCFQDNSDAYDDEDNISAAPSAISEPSTPAATPVVIVTSPNQTTTFVFDRPGTSSDIEQATSIEHVNDDDDEPLELIDDSIAKIVPEYEHDRRTGLGPLQLLNIAFKKGSFKLAVKDALRVKKKHEKLMQQQKTDEKTIKKMMKEELPGKILADFDENKFDEIALEAGTSKQDDTDDVGMTELDSATEKTAIEEKDPKVEDEDVESEDDIEDEINRGPIVQRYLYLVQDFLTYVIAFLKLFLLGALESVIIWLLKLSLEYRYVARVLGHDKAHYKQYMTSNIIQENIDQNVTQQKQSIKSMVKDEEEKFHENRHVLIRLFVAIFYLILSRSDLFCYFLIVLNHMSSCSFLTAPLPIMAFVWGTLSVPRPTKNFWITMILYTEAMVIMKYIFQFGFFPWNKYAPPPDPLWGPRIFGVEKHAKYAGWDLALLIALFLHTSVMKSLGLWDNLKENETSIEGAKINEKSFFPENENGIRLRKRRSAINMDNMKTTCKKFIYTCFNLELIEQQVANYISNVIKFYRALLHPENRLSVDVYVPMFLCDFICFFTVIFGYASFGPDSTGGVAGALEDDKVPAPFLAMLVVQFVLIVTDRALFLRKYLLGKIIYQVVLVFFIHIWMFLILPNATERQFINNRPAQIWYFTKCMYLVLSASQIRSGYPMRVLGNVLTKKYNYINMMLFKGFMNIPFLFELRSLMDWIWTDTSMSLSDWLKMEDIYANIYMLKCVRKAEEDYPTPRGEKRRPYIKYGYGGALLVSLILIIWFPLVLFSLANTVGLENYPVDCTFKLSIGAYPTLYTFTAHENDMRSLTAEEYDTLRMKYKNNKMAISYMSDYSHSDVIQVTLGIDSTNNWAISPPSRRALIDNLQSDQPMTIKYEWIFTRPPESSIGATVQISDENVVNIPQGSTDRNYLIQLIKNETTVPFLLPNLYPLYVKLPGKGKSSHVTALLLRKGIQDPKMAYTDVSLSLQRDDKQDWWQLRSVGSSSEKIVMFAFVDKVFPTTFTMIAGGGVIGVYATLILIVGKYIRSLVTGSMQKIMFEELPNVDRILQLCLDLLFVREAGELMLEEELFAKIVFLYRSPATLIKWTKSKD